MTPTSPFKCCNSLESHLLLRVNYLDSLSHLELNSRCPGDEALEKMGIFGAITSGSCLLEGPRVSGCLYLVFGGNPLLWKNCLQRKHPTPCSLCVAVFPPRVLRGVLLSVLSIIASVLMGCN